MERERYRKMLQEAGSSRLRKTETGPVVMVAHALNLSAWEAEAGGSLEF